MLELATDILLDFTGDDGEPLVTREVATRMAERALPVVATDLGVTYRLEGDTVTPQMPGDHREAWLIRSKILVCRLLRAQASQRVDFSSGDKSVNRSGEAKTLADLEKSLWDEYTALIKKLSPLSDETLIRLEAMPLTYKVGRHLPERD